MKQHRLLWRIYFYFLAATLAAIAVLALYAVHSMQGFVEDQTLRNLTIRAQMVAETCADTPFTNNAGNINLICSALGRITEARITIILPDGKVIGDSDRNPLNMDNHLNRPEVVQAFRGEIGESSRFSDTLKKTLEYITVPLKRGGEIVAVVRLSQPVAEIRWTQRIIIRQILMGTISAVLLFAVVALYLSRQITRPLEAMREIADQLAEGNLSSRVSITSTDEIGSLAQSINKMATQLDMRIKTIARQQVEQKAVLSCMTEGVLAVDPDGKLLYLNKTAAKLLNTTKEDALDRSIQEIVRHHDLQVFISDSLRKTDAAKAEIIINDVDERYIQVHSTPLTDPTGWSIGGLVVINDITQLKRLETMRSDFVANVSHELKTPITALKGCVETLASDQPLSSDETVNFNLMMERHVERLEAIVEDLLVLSRIEFDMKESHIELTQSSVCKLLERTVQTFAKRVELREIEIKITCSEELSAPINNALLEQAVGNLIDNAIKYSESETVINITASQNGDQIIIEVADQGSGIASHHLSRIFERFYRVDKARSRAFGGTGLGLSIVKHIALAHQGGVTVKSTFGKGCTFAITLPTG